MIKEGPLSIQHKKTSNCPDCKRWTQSKYLKGRVVCVVCEYDFRSVWKIELGDIVYSGGKKYQVVKSDQLNKTQ